MSVQRGPQGNALIQLVHRTPLEQLGVGSQQSFAWRLFLIVPKYISPACSQTKYPSIDLPLRKEQQEKGKIASP
jgi:hypothetical protein